jgi:hypothetical protein
VDCNVSLNSVLAWLCWGSVATMIVVAAFDPHPVVMMTGLAASAAAATLHIRCFVNGLREREIQAFDLGRDTVRQIR